MFLAVPFFNDFTTKAQRHIGKLRMMVGGDFAN